MQVDIVLFYLVSKLLVQQRPVKAFYPSTRITVYAYGICTSNDAAAANVLRGKFSISKMEVAKIGFLAIALHLQSNTQTIRTEIDTVSPVFR